MTPSTPTIGASDALDIASLASRQRDNEAAGLPIAIRAGNEVQILVMILGRGGPEIGYKPPKFAVTLALDGKVVKAGPTSGKELGILAPDAREPGVGAPDDLSVDDYLSSRDQFYELSPKVWEAFAAGRAPKEPDLRPILAEYWRLFNLSCSQGIAPFYLQASPAFFAWVRSAAEPKL